MELPFDPSVVLPGILAGDPDAVGERFVRFFLSIWSNADARGPFLALLRAASTSEEAAAMLRSFVEQALLGRAVAALPPAPDRHLRMALAASQLIGMALLRFVVKVEPLASASEDEIVGLVAPTLQRYLAGPYDARSDG
jgi:hypothetical protein